MKTQNKVLLTVIAIIFMVVTLNAQLPYAQDLNKQTWVSHIFPQETKLSMENQEQHTKEYYEKYKALGCDINTVEYAKYYYNKVNINAYEQFKAIGLDLVETSAKDYIREMASIRNPLYMIATSQVIFTGKVVKEENISNPNAMFHTCYYLLPDEFLKGKEYYKTKPDTIKLYSEKGKIVYNVDGKIFSDEIGTPYGKELDIGQNAIIFVNKQGEDHMFKKSNYRKSIESYTDTNFRNYYPKDFIENNVFWINGYNVISSGTRGTRTIGKNLIWINDQVDIPSAVKGQKFYDNYLVQLKKQIETYQEINDDANFYQRSYK